ncbi:MAG: 50S ribosomal protein L15 [Chlamydiia bacterium]|nr:50S ribosomal protein L15 [Chlamydiia bacterium]
MTTQLSNLQNSSNARAKKKRVGRGPGSGMGKTSCRGQKGAGARSGWKARYGNAGGNQPLFKKLPTRGFTNGKFKKDVVAFNVAFLQNFFKEGEEVNRAALVERGLVSSKSRAQIKVLGDGELTVKLNVTVDACSAGAKEKIEKAGGSVSLSTK